MPGLKSLGDCRWEEAGQQRDLELAWSGPWWLGKGSFSGQLMG